MSHKYEKLKTLLKELFQLDQPDLDFGLYRVMHAKSAEVSQFLDKDLLPQVQAAFGQYRTADKAELEKELAKVVASIEAAGMNPADSPKVKELGARLKSDAVDVGALESEVYDRLFGFFRRYYSEGDFLAKRVYKPGVYAIPYEGEEVTLHWANKDQYYIKTSEYLRDYAFRLRPDDGKMPMRVHFRLADAVEGEHGNVKATEGKDRVFILSTSGTSSRDFIAVVDGEQGKELDIRFEYRPATLADWPEGALDGKTKPPTQKDLSALAAKRILALADDSLAEWVAELSKPHVTTGGEMADYTRLDAHLRRYTARNTFDYFIHKDLRTFLRRELDFYIKNEVMHLDDVENESSPRVEQYLSKIKVIRRIAGKIIDFLAQLEDFQKKLWLKRKFIVETSWCVRLGCIPETFLAEIAANGAQRDEWVQLLSIDEIKGSLTAPGYTSPLSVEFLKSHQTLTVDTRHFSQDFSARLLSGFVDVDDQTDGLIVQGDNFHALALFRGRYAGQVTCTFIDPPYNTENGDFNYKDNYQHSSWLTMMSDRLESVRLLSASGAALFATIDDNEFQSLSEVVRQTFGGRKYRANIVWQKKDTPANDALGLSVTHDYLLVVPVDDAFQRGLVARTEEQESLYRNPDDDPRGPWTRTALVIKRFVKGNDFPLTNPAGNEIRPPAGLGWSMSRERIDELIEDNRVWWGQNADGVPFQKTFLSEVKRGVVPVTWWDYEFAGSNRNARAELRSLFRGEPPFDTPKPTQLIARVLQLGNGAVTLDFFAGSGTTGHAVINLNREDGGQRRFVLVETGDYFDTVVLPRLKKVTFTPEWKDGKPKRLATPEEAERSPRIMKVLRLESYEDALNNLETHRSNTQQLLLNAADAKDAGGLKEQYILHYLLNVETRGSQSLLNVEAFTDPTAYKLKVKRPGTDESREMNVDLSETFNWLIGLTVKHMVAPQTFSTAFQRDSEGRLRLKGRLKQDAAGQFWFRTVTGTSPDGRKTLVIWRKLSGNPEEDNLVLDEWFTKQGYSSKDSEFDLIYVNGGNNLENLKAPDDTWKVRLIEEDFHRLMFDGEAS